MRRSPEVTLHLFSLSLCVTRFLRAERAFTFRRPSEAARPGCAGGYWRCGATRVVVEGPVFSGVGASSPLSRYAAFIEGAVLGSCLAREGKHLHVC